MGWNSWNWHGKQAINESIVVQTIDAMVSTGLRDAGYTYVVVDGGWRDTHTGPNGELLVHPTKFPRGMKYLADYAHARGLKFGLHTVPGTHDCGGDAVGGFGREELHIRQFVEWGIDFVKLDKCRLQAGWNETTLKAVYTRWSQLLSSCGRPIMFSISAYKFRNWYPEISHMARTTPDIWARVAGGAMFDTRPPDADKPTRKPAGLLSVMEVTEMNNAAAASAGNGYWNDPDMMVTGAQGLTADEQATHFALWCIMSSPLFLGNDPCHMDEAEKRLILNRECIAVNQDPTEQGRRIRTDGSIETWVKRLQGGKLAVLLLNRDSAAAQSATLRAEDVGAWGAFQARDLFAREDIRTVDAAITKVLPPHGSAFFVVTRGSGAH